MLLAALLVGSVGFAADAWAAGDAASGKAKASACAMCHGPLGQGTQMAPRLAGADPAHTVKALQDFQSGKRDNPMMKAQAGRLSPDDMANLAAYYASLE
jgi:cytochrome c553